MRYAKIRKLDVTNGPGIRTTLFVSGCTHNCEGCFNKEQQDFNYGNEFTKETENEFIEYTKSRSGQVSRGSASEYQADEQAVVPWLRWRVSGR